MTGFFARMGERAAGRQAPLRVRAPQRFEPAPRWGPPRATDSEAAVGRRHRPWTSRPSWTPPAPLLAARRRRPWRRRGTAIATCGRPRRPGRTRRAASSRIRCSALPRLGRRCSRAAGRRRRRTATGRGDRATPNRRLGSRIRSLPAPPGRPRRRSPERPSPLSHRGGSPRPCRLGTPRRFRGRGSGGRGSRGRAARRRRPRPPARAARARGAWPGGAARDRRGGHGRAAADPPRPARRGSTTLTVTPARYSTAGGQTGQAPVRHRGRPASTAASPSPPAVTGPPEPPQVHVHIDRVVVARPAPPPRPAPRRAGAPQPPAARPRGLPRAPPGGVDEQQPGGRRGDLVPSATSSNAPRTRPTPARSAVPR